MNTYSSHIKITTDSTIAYASQLFVHLHRGMGIGHMLSDEIRDAFEASKEESATSITFSIMNGMDNHVAAHAILRCIFAHLRDDSDGKEQIVIHCQDESAESVFEDCFWDESLTLVGKYEEREKYKFHIDNLTLDFWNNLFNTIPMIEKGEEGWERNFGFCSSYVRWVQVFDLIKPENYMDINNLYCLCIDATLMSRTYHWTDTHPSPQIVLTMMRALQNATRIYPYIFAFRVIAELHNRGHELLRICPALSPNGASWRCIATTKDKTFEQSGAMCADTSFNATTINISNGNLFKQKDDKLDIMSAADRFCKEYPVLAKASKGSDPEYKKWFRHALHLAQQGQIFYAVSDMDNCMRKGRMLGTKEPLSFPPGGTVNHKTMK